MYVPAVHWLPFPLRVKAKFVTRATKACRISHLPNSLFSLALFPWFSLFQDTAFLFQYGHSFHRAFTQAVPFFLKNSCPDTILAYAFISFISSDHLFSVAILCILLFLIFLHFIFYYSTHLFIVWFSTTKIYAP